MTSMDDWWRQCRGCRHLWPCRSSHIKCPQCGKSAFYEALDTSCSDSNEIELAALRRLVSNIVIGAALRRARDLG